MSEPNKHKSNQQSVDALHEIMRQASYLPLHSIERRTIEDAASAALRWVRAHDLTTPTPQSPTNG